MTRHDRIDAGTRVARHRAALRAQGYRLKQIWVPDTRTAAFRAQAERDARTIHDGEGREQDLTFAESIRHWPEDGSG